jgi:acetyl-CoA C-acetyltransferase
METVTLTADQCTRPRTTAEGLPSVRPVIDGGVLTAANASRRSDRAAACVVVDATEAERRGIDPLALYRGFAGLGCEPDEMGIGSVFAVRGLLDRLGLSLEDIDG